MTDRKSPADLFREMAQRLERNEPGEFQGAYLIIPPSGKPVSQAFVDPSGDEVAFWGFVQAQVVTAGTEAIGDAERKLGLGIGIGLRR